MTTMLPPTSPKPAPPKRADLWLSVALPVAVIALGIVVTLGQAPLAAFVDLCVSVLP